MINLSKWAIDNRRLVNFLVVVLLLGGVSAYLKMPKLEDPEITVKEAMISTLYPGASPHEVELEVTDVLEKSIRSMTAVSSVSSTSMENASLIRVTLATTIKEEEVQQTWDMLRRKVADVQSKLPAGASPSVVADNFGDVYGMFYALSYSGYNHEEAGKYADLVKQRMKQIEGVSDVTIYGKRSENIYIDLSEDKLATLGVHPSEVMATLQGQNATIYSGYYESGTQRIRMSVSDRYRSAEEIGDVVLQGHEDDQLRMRDIGKVYAAYSTPIRSAMRYDAQDALGIAISAKSGTDITQVGLQVAEAMQELVETRLPAGMEINKVFFQPDRVNSALSDFIINLIESVLLVVLVLIFSMGLRSGLILGAGLLITVVGTILFLDYFDGTLQRVSLVSFVLAMGMLVDNAIVILDGIQIDLSKGVDRHKALTSIGEKTAMPLLGATLIAILAFLPIFLSPDTTGIYMRDLFIVLGVSLFLSWILALVVVPLHADKFLKVKPMQEGEDPYDGKAYRILKALVSWGLNHRLMSVGIASAVVAISLLCYGLMPQGLFPDMDYNQIYVEYRLPDGYSSSQIDKDLSEIEQYLLAREDVEHVTSAIGGTPARYNLVRSVATPSLSYGELIVDYASPSDAVASIPELERYLKDRYPDAQIKVKRYNLMFKEFPVEVEFRGPDPAVLHSLTSQALAVMDSVEGIAMKRNNWAPKVPVLTIDYDQPKARAQGLSRRDVGLSVLAATDGVPAGTFYDGVERKGIVVRSVGKDGKPIESVENVPVFGLIPSLGASVDRDVIQGLMTGALTKEDMLASILKTSPLSLVSDGISISWQEPTILRQDGVRAMRAQCLPALGYTATDVRNAIVQQIESIPLPDGYSLHWEGEYKASQDSMKYLFGTYPLAIILMIAILIMLFGDYRKPAIIVLCLPLLLIGVIFGILLSGKTFSFVAIVATLGLVGMLTKNAIVLVDEITLLVSQGVAEREALVQSALSRFRPIMLASLTTILGMIPLLSDSLFGPAAVVIMAGLLVSSVASVFFLPILYALFFKVK